MDENARAIFERAYAALDRVDEQRAIWAAEREMESDDQRFARENAEADAFLERCRERRLEQAKLDRPLVFKTYEPKAEQAMTDSDRAWVQQWVQRQLEGFASILGAETGKNETKLAKVLREEIGQLRAEIEILRQYKANKPDASVAGSVTSLKGRSVNVA